MKKKKYKALCKKLKQPKANYFGCFTKLGHEDKRLEKFVRERKELGFDSSETWNLSQTITLFLLPRLKHFREIHPDNPSEISFDEWNDVLDKMILTFEHISHQYDTDYIPTKSEFNKINKEITTGLQLFAKWFQHLWW